VDYLIVNYGFSSSLNLKDWGITSSRQGIPVRSDMRSSMEGVYCCGDITLYDGKVNLIATGFGEAPTAVNNALHYINPKNRTQPAHSTSLFQE
jgi:thioredoxin reductase (NADPH)